MIKALPWHLDRPRTSGLGFDKSFRVDDAVFDEAPSKDEGSKARALDTGHNVLGLCCAIQGEDRST